MSAAGNMKGGHSTISWLIHDRRLDVSGVFFSLCFDCKIVHGTSHPMKRKREKPQIWHWQWSCIYIDCISFFSLSNTSHSARTLRSMLCEGLKMDWKREKKWMKNEKAKTKWIVSIVCDCLDAHETRKPTSVALRKKKNQCIFRGRGSGIGVGNAFVVSQPDMHITLMHNTISAPQSFALCKIVHVSPAFRLYPCVAKFFLHNVRVSSLPTCHGAVWKPYF